MSWIKKLALAYRYTLYQILASDSGNDLSLRDSVRQCEVNTIMSYYRDVFSDVSISIF